MSFEIGRSIDIGMGSNGIELKLFFEHILHGATKLVADSVPPSCFCTGIIAGVKCKDKEEVDIVMREQQRIAVIESVFELMSDRGLIGMRLGIVFIRQCFLVDRSRNEEIGNYIVALGNFIKEPYALELVSHVWIAIEPYIEIPLYNITRIGALFIDGFLAERVADFIIFGVADVVNIIVGFIVD